MKTLISVIMIFFVISPAWAESITLKTKEFLFLLKGNLMEENRLGIIVGKKHVPLSVERNRLRRLIREGFRTILDPELRIDLIVLVRPGINKNKKG